MVICFFGDSLTNGFGDQACLGWAGRICVQQGSLGRALTYYNLGVRKHTSREVAARWRKEAECRELEGFETRLVFAFGTGDAAIMDGVRRISPEETVENARDVLTEAREQYKVLFVGPPPVGDAEFCARSTVMSGLLGTVCAECRVPYFDLMGRLSQTGAYLEDVVANDGVHPRSAGYALTAELVSSWPAWQEWFE